VNIGSVSTAPDAKSCADGRRGDPDEEDGGVEHVDADANVSDVGRDVDEEADEEEE